jgi:hypothetical protein
VPVVDPRVIYEHGEPQWSDIDSGKVLTGPPELSGNATVGHLVANQEDFGEICDEYSL